jgi:hypothetical protein
MKIATLHEKAATEQAVRDEVEIRAMVDLIHKAHHDKNGAAIAAAYQPNAAVFNLAPPRAKRIQLNCTAWPEGARHPA